MATGCLSSVNRPKFKGLASFEGRWYHTGQWPPEGVDFSGQRVGVIGTGSTAIQAIPRIARQARHLHVFQRTPNFSIPAHNGPLDAEAQRQIKATYPARREKARHSRVGLPMDAAEKGALEVSPEERQATYEARWAEGGVGFLRGYKDLLTSAEANDTAAEFVRSKIAESVRDPAVAELLMPRDYPIGTKRLCIDIDYYQTYNRDNVTLVDVRTAPIQELTQHGLRTQNAEYVLDTIVFAIGFDAMTGALFDVDLRGRDGEPLQSCWAHGPRTYLGLAVAGFPNLFLVTGPGSPSVLSNMVISIEQHVDWIADCIGYLGEHGLERIEATAAAEERWQRHVGDVAHLTLYPRARSWYTGANIPGKPRGFMPYVGGVGAYRKLCDDVVASGYVGFELGR
jgi:cyclohexanone monooxygenase